jgi:predicted RNase H-like HicB family nuclease
LFRLRPGTLATQVLRVYINLTYGAEGKMRQVIIYPGEDQYWVAECPSLPGCISQGRTREEAVENIREAIQGYIAALEEDRLPVPAERLEALLVVV